MPGPQRNRYTTKEKADFKALGKLLKYCKSYVVAILVALFFCNGCCYYKYYRPQ